MPPTSKKNNNCGATAKSTGKTCVKPAGWGTDHPGTGNCKWHGGSTPNGIEHAAKAEMVIMGAPVENLHPGDALLYCCKIAAGEIEYCNLKISEMQIEDVLVNPEAQDIDEFVLDNGVVGASVKRKVKEETLNIWIKVRQGAVERLAKYCKMALDANVDERRVQMAERYGEDLGRLFRAVFSELGLTPAQARKAPDILQKQLAQLETVAGGIG